MNLIYLVLSFVWLQSFLQKPCSYFVQSEGVEECTQKCCGRTRASAEKDCSQTCTHAMDCGNLGHCFSFPRPCESNGTSGTDPVPPPTLSQSTHVPSSSPASKQQQQPVDEHKKEPVKEPTKDTSGGANDSVDKEAPGKDTPSDPVTGDENGSSEGGASPVPTTGERSTVLSVLLVLLLVVAAVLAYVIVLRRSKLKASAPSTFRLGSEDFEDDLEDSLPLLERDAKRYKSQKAYAKSWIKNTPPRKPNR